jgi:hypothetical protein
MLHQLELLAVDYRTGLSFQAGTGISLLCTASKLNLAFLFALVTVSSEMERK